MRYQSRFTNVPYDKLRGLKQLALREKFLELEKYVVESYPTKELSTDPFRVVSAFITTVFPGNPRGQEAGYEAFWHANDAFLARLPLDVCLNHLEVAYMWFGKAIRDEQLAQPK